MVSEGERRIFKIYDWYHSSNAYFTHLIRTYRKVTNKFIEKKKYTEAFLENQEMFSKCPNHLINENFNFFILLHPLLLP